ncbi:ABC transporter ATP-binding protein [Parvibium lacunae]|uniref:ABC transporter ATP-binding protein n=1 Tax=Parvibium lacunae TaxID=1888893 RepID=A0A368L305_9BURK|nr:ABC transporter ATP-binding protein [Parvibium lacunae]RCS57488.1 ABC transporter ATP-binding protein [Parvibium lacunae]
MQPQLVSSSAADARTSLAKPFIRFDRVRFAYAVGQREILKGIDIEVQQGHVVALMGGSGCGKTTLLRLLGGQYQATQGQVLIDGQNVASLDKPGLYALRRRMGMLFQFGALFTDMSVFDNVAFPLREHTALPESMIRDLVLMKLQAVGLRGASQLMPSQISGGMGRRVALARAIALDPALMMYDEPFAGLDPISMNITAHLIRQLNDALGITSLIVSHDVDETFAIADYVYVMADGVVAAEGTPAELRASSDPLVHQFVHGEAEGPVPFHQPVSRTLAADLGLQEAS